MPYQPTNPYPYNTGIDVNDGLKFNFKVDNYDTINKFKLELYDLFRNEKVYTIIRTTGAINEETREVLIDAFTGEIKQGDSQIIQILDNNDEQILLEEYVVTDESGILSPNNMLPISGGMGEQSVCELQLDKYMVTVENIEKRKYYGSISNFENLVVANEDWFIMADNSNTIIQFNPHDDEGGNNYTLPVQLVVPYRINGRMVEAIGDNVFNPQYNDNNNINNFNNIKEIIVPASVFSIGESCFENAQIDRVLFNYGNTEIKNKAFKNSAIIDVVLLDSISFIGESIFEGCSLLYKVVLSHTLDKIPNSCFKNCISLNIIEFLSNIKTIENNAFEGCYSLYDINCVEGLEKIKDEVFMNCINLMTIKLPNSLQEIGKQVFKGNNSLIEMTVPFVGKKRNQSDIYKDSNTMYVLGETGVLGYFFESQQTEETGWIKQLYTETEYVYSNIPTTLRIVNITDSIIINSGTFCNCNTLYEVVLNNEIVGVGDYAFYNCDYIDNFIVGHNVIVIGKYAFAQSETIVNGGEDI